mgnify:FL=1
MKNKIFKKTIVTIIIFTLVFPFLSFYPKKVRAQLATVDAGNIVQNTITATNSTASSLKDYSMWIKEYVLDGLASGLAKMIIRTLTSSVVNWINSGFQGSPSFVQNPGAFFLDMADQITGDFLSQAGGPLVSLCSPFSIDIRIALAFKYHPNIQKRYTCTLGTIIKNSKNAVANASINGFTAGDFKQGGWPAFVSLTTEPQNNIYGAYLTAESELSWRVAQGQSQQKDELGQGKGFLSWKKCKDIPILSDKNAAVVASEDPNDPRLSAYYEGVPEKKCEVQTPGSVIEGALQNSIGGPLRELELADEFNEIVNALFAQLVSKVLQGGLKGVSSKDATGKSYLNQTVAEINAEGSPQVKKMKEDILNSIEPYIKDTETYRKYKNDALNIMLSVKNAYDDVKKCYIGKAGLNPSLTSEANARIEAIDGIINSTVAPLASSVLSQSQEADSRLNTLIKIGTDVNNAKTLNDLNGPSQKLSGLINSKSLTTPKDIQDAIESLDKVKADSASMSQNAGREMQRCQLFPNG